MFTIDFPDPRTADEEGLVAIGGRLDVETLRAAYARGIFPWAYFMNQLCWFSPDPRGVLVFDKLHVPRSLHRAMKKSPLRFTIDTAFRRVIEMCAQVKRAEGATWIAEDFIAGYTAWHEAGDAHSVEAWDADGQLVGGLYGVDVGGVFAGESMFHLQPNASKLALLFLVEHLKTGGAQWMDIQVLTPHLAALGAEEIRRDKFLKMLEAARSKGARLF